MSAIKDQRLTPVGERVKRWDVYDIADELADVPGMIARAISGQPIHGESPSDIYAKLSGLEIRLWEAAERSGAVGPYPLYEAVEL